MKKLKSILQGIKDVLNVLGNYLLNILALMLLLILYIPNVIIQIIVASLKSSTLKVASKMQFEDAYLIDVYGATIYREFFNVTCVKSSSNNLFGSYIDKTISWYLAVNKEDKTLTGFGVVVYYLILIADFTTWFSGGHFNFIKNKQ